MAEFKETVQALHRMCDYYNDEFKDYISTCTHEGEECPALKSNCDVINYDWIEDVDEMEKIALKWAKEHPVKTNADKFEEVFGVHIHHPMDICELVDCSNIECIDCKLKGFWDKPYEEKKDDR